MRKQRFVIDTCAFTNVGTSKAQISRNMRKLINLLAHARESNISCYTPPSIWKELKGMLVRKKVTSKTINKLDAWLIQKSPNRAELKVPAEFLYEYVGDVRERFNKGLRAAEKALTVVETGKHTCAITVKKLRNKYKTAIRKGMLDSIEDLDLLLLAKELNAAIVSKDAGIKRWARKWGIRYIKADSFHNLLKEYERK